MPAFIVIGARWLGAICAISVLGAAVWAFMAGIDRRRDAEQREREREQDFWRTARQDPRKPKPRNWRPPSGFAA